LLDQHQEQQHPEPQNGWVWKSPLETI